MQVNCPNCSRPVETSKAILTGPAQTIRCQWCGNHFAMHGGNPITTGEFRKIKQSTSADEVWELDADAPEASASSGSVLDDMEFDSGPADPSGLMLFPSEDLSDNAIGGGGWEDTPDAMPAAQEPMIPDLPSAPAQVEALVEQLGAHSWTDSADLDGSVPELPDFGDLEFQDATPASAPPPLEPLPPEETNPPPAAVIRSGPPPRVEESIDDLLGDFISDTGGEELILRFYIRRNRKDYGPFTEEEVHSLLESRKLTGDEMSRQQNEKEWMPLRERPDFKPTISILEKQAVRVGWDGQASAEPPGPPPPAPELPQQDIPTLDLSELDNRPDLREQYEASMQPGTPVVVLPEEADGSQGQDAMALLTDVRFLSGLAIGLLLIVAGVWWSTRSSKSTGKQKRQTGISFDKLKRADDYPSYKILRVKLGESFRKNPFHLYWYKVRFLYYMLDSHGEDRAVRADIKPITEKLLKRQKGKLMGSRLRLARAVSLRDKDKIQEAFDGLAKPLPPQDAEWGFLLGRTKELLGKTESANELYKALVAKYPDHIRARLGLFRTLRKLGKERAAARQLFQASQQARQHLPTQLTAVAFATSTGRWDSQVPKMLSRIKKQVAARRYTQSSLARWNALLARRHWVQRKLDKAIHHIERAATLAPGDYDIFLTKVQYYRWSRQYFMALHAIKKKQAWRLKHPTLLFAEFAILKESRQKHKLEPMLNGLQPKAVTPAQKSVMYTLLGDYYMLDFRVRDALQSYIKAEKARGDEPSPPYGAWAMIRLYMKEKQWKRAEKLLEQLRAAKPLHRETRVLWGQYLFHQKRYKEALAVAKSLKDQYHTQYHGYLLASRIYRRTVGLQRAITELRRALYFHPERPSGLLMTLSELYLEQDKPARALRSLGQYEKLLQGAPPCKFLARKAEVLRQLKRCQALVQLKAKRCKQFKIHLARGQCAERLEQKSTALRAYKRARMLAPESLEPLEALANYYKKEGNLTESSRLFNILNRKRPSDKSNLLSLVKLYEGRQLYVLALTQILKRRHIFKKDFDVNLARARLEGSLNRTKRALKQLRRLRSQASTKKRKGQLQHAYGRTYATAKKYRQAIKAYQSAIASTPRDAVLYLELGTIYYRKKQYKECLGMAKKFLSRARRRSRNKRRGRALKKACTHGLKNP